MVRPHPSVVCALLAALMMFGCSRQKPVPFGLGDAGVLDAGADVDTDGEVSDLPMGEMFDAGQVEIEIEESTLVLENGYAIAALRFDLDKDDEIEALVVSHDGDEIRLEAAHPQGMTVRTRQIGSFMVPAHCTEPRADIRVLSESLISVRVEHRCEGGARQNYWILSLEAQPRVRERLTVLPETQAGDTPIGVSLRAEDRDGDGYEDVVVDVEVGTATVPLTWLNRPGGFARDGSQPEATFEQLASEAASLIDSDPRTASKLAADVLSAFDALCRESGTARIGLSGTQGLQCLRSPGAAKASAVAAASSIRRGDFVRALEYQRWWDRPATAPTSEDRALVQEAWQQARAKSTANWRRLDAEASPVPIYFADSDTLIIGGRHPRKVELSTGNSTPLEASDLVPPIRDPEGRFRVAGVRSTCAGYEAQVGPLLGKRTHRVSIDRAPGTHCATPIDRPASAFEWAVLGWAPQGLVAASGDQLRIVPVDGSGKPAGQPIDLEPGSPLPAPIRGARITPDGRRYVIPHAEGIVVRDWKTGATGLWLRPPDWHNVPGQVQSVAISPDGQHVALQKGTEIRLLTW